MTILVDGWLIIRGTYNQLTGVVLVDHWLTSSARTSVYIRPVLDISQIILTGDKK